ncbi:hypothetical protein MTO96_008851 [Rhipicephalus appendiculatus]
MVRATIWVAKTFPPWQLTILTTLKQLFQKHNGLPDNKVVSAELKDKPELKKHMKKVMPFAQAVREKVEKLGIGALNVTLDFDEREVLLENLSDTFVNVCCINQQQSSGCFEVQVPVLDGDSAAKVLARLGRMGGHVSFDGVAVKLLRYEDPTMGPRKIPTLGCEETGKVVIPNEAIFRIKADKSGVEVELDGTRVDVGSQMSYIVVPQSLMQLP